MYVKVRVMNDKKKKKKKQGKERSYLTGSTVCCRAEAALVFVFECSLFRSKPCVMETHKTRLKNIKVSRILKFIFF